LELLSLGGGRSTLSLAFGAVGLAGFACAVERSFGLAGAPPWLRLGPARDALFCFTLSRAAARLDGPRRCSLP
jgi:hypothetical protein